MSIFTTIPESMNANMHLHAIADLLKMFPRGLPIRHPLITVVDFTKLGEHDINGLKVSADFYGIMFKNYNRNNLKYGRKPIDFQDGNLFCMAPNQIIEMDEEVEENANMMGWGLFFHPDLIRGTWLGEKMPEYNFFAYEISESLHLSEKEKQTLYECVQKIEAELQENIDTYSQNIIVSTLGLLLDYCTRFYGRQFITRKSTNNTVVAQVEKILSTWFRDNDNNEKGLPAVKYIAEQVHLSPGYLSDLLKKETGKNTQDHIHYYVIEEAKNLLIGTNQSVAEVAYALGFEYPQYFNRLFRQKTGKTPVEYRKMNE